jgi:hypothetical protein
MARQPGCERPPAVGLLRRQQPLGHAAVLLGALAAEEPVDEDLFGFQVRRALDDSLPEATRALERQQRAGRPCDGLVHPPRVCAVLEELARAHVGLTPARA